MHICAKRPDGFHNIETVFYPVNLCDSLEITPSDNGQDQLHVHGLKWEEPMENNLVFKALQLLRKDYDIPAVRIDLLKNIPTGAGLGGGSADAAYMLKLVNTTYDLGLNESQLEAYARQLGSDCAFFVRNKPVYADEKGDRFFSFDYSLENFHLLIVKPNVHVSTTDAYGGVKPMQPSQDIREVLQQDMANWKHTLVNDFEKGIFKKFPVIQQVKEKLYSAGANYACMSGSGASVFGLFKDEPLLTASDFPDCFFFTTRL